MIWRWIKQLALFAHRTVGELERWGILLAVIGLGLTLWQLRLEVADREEDRINRAISQFADGVGRSAALQVLLRNNVDLRFLVAPNAFLPAVHLTQTASGEKIDLSGARLNDSYLDLADFRGSVLERISFKNASLARSDFFEAEAGNSDFSETNLAFAEFKRAMLQSSTFKSSFAHSTNFDEANLRAANLSQMRAFNVSFRGADLSDAHLEGSNFERADFSNADLSRTDLYRVLNINNALFCETIMPDGTRCDRDCRPAGQCSWGNER